MEERKHEQLILSTPHGTLGTQAKHSSPTHARALSTPHGTLGTEATTNWDREFSELSTPHGTLGTLVIGRVVNFYRRCFQLHTVH